MRNSFVQELGAWTLVLGLLERKAAMAREYKLPSGRKVSLHEAADIIVYLAQCQLNTLGTDPRLAEDGLMGPHTRRAFDRLQP
jgi:hypothetical protein